MAVTRRYDCGHGAQSGARITRAEALRMWTSTAFLSLTRRIKGSIEPGKLADMVGITKDYLSCPVDEIKSIEPL